MSELQDIIVNSSVKAFNSGLAHGVVQERERIIKLLEAQAKRSSSEAYRRAFLQLIADLPYTVEEIHGEAEQ